MGTIADRDLYEIHHFFSSGFGYKNEVVEARTGEATLICPKELRKFIADEITQKIVNGAWIFYLITGSELLERV